MIFAVLLLMSSAACANVGNSGKNGDTGASGGKTSDSEKKPVMGVCIFAIEAEYFTNLAHWLEEAGEAHGWEVIVQSGDASNPSSQVEIIENFITMGVDAVFVNPINMDALEDVLAKAKDKGIWILGHNYRYEDSELPDIYMSGNPEEAGAEITELAKAEIEKLGIGQKIVVAALTSMDNENNSKRSQGMTDKARELWGEDCIVAENSPVGTEEAITASENIMQANPDVNVWLCYNDECAIGVYEFYNSSGRDQSQTVIVGADGNKDVLEAVIAGTAVRGTLSQTLNVKCQKFFDAADILIETGDVKQAQEKAGYNIFSPVNKDNAQEELDSASWK